MEGWVRGPHGHHIVPVAVSQHRVGWGVCVSLHRDPQDPKICSLFLASLNIFQNNYQKELMLAHIHSLSLRLSLSLLLSVSFPSLYIYTQSPSWGSHY